MKLLSYIILAGGLLFSIDGTAQSKQSNRGPAKEEAGKAQTISFAFNRGSDKPEMSVTGPAAEKRSKKHVKSPRFRSGDETSFRLAEEPAEPLRIAGNLKEESAAEPKGSGE